MCPKKPKVNYADVKCTLSSLKQFHSDILTKRESHKKKICSSKRARRAGGGGWGRVVAHSIPFLYLPVFFTSFTWKDEIVLHSEHICVRDTVILYVFTFLGFLCTSVIPRVRHSVKLKMASTCPLKTGTFESKGRFNSVTRVNK